MDYLLQVIFSLVIVVGGACVAVFVGLCVLEWLGRWHSRTSSEQTDFKSPQERLNEDRERQAKLNEAHEREAKRRGKVGEDIVKQELECLDDEHVVFNNIHLPVRHGTTTQIDHLVFSPYGVTVIETKNWCKAWLFCGRKSRYWTLIRSYGKKRTKVENPFQQNYWHLKAVAHATRLPHRYFENMVVLVDDNCELKVDRPEGLFYADELRDHFRRPRERVFSVEELGQTIDRIIDVLSIG